MGTFETDNFPVMPVREALVAAIEAAGLGRVDQIALFPHSSCTPAFDVRLTNERSRRIVVRGEQQNDIVSSPAEAITLEKEIFTFSLLRSSGVNVPAVLLDCRILHVPARDRRNGRDRRFRFILLQFVPGIAMDRRVVASDGDGRAYFLDRIAKIYAGLHKTVGRSFGIMDAVGTPVNGAPNFQTFISRLLANKSDLVDEHYGPDLANAVRRWCTTYLRDLLRRIESAGYAPTPRLVLYDGAAGNMLISGRRIGIVDVALTGFYETTMEFCSFFLGLRDILTQRHDDGTYWDYFLGCYHGHGGALAPKAVLTDLMHVGLVNLLLHNVVYNATHFSAVRHARAESIAASIQRMLPLERPDLSGLAAAVS